MSSNDDKTSFQSGENEETSEDIGVGHAGHAARELHYGRIEWLAYHIRRSNFRIDPIVAKKLLALIEKTDSDLFFELRLVRRADLPAAFKDPQLTEFRNRDMALEVARRGGFERGHGKRVYHEVAELFGLKSGEYVYRCVRPYRDSVMASIEEEEMQAAYERGEIDILGRPISPNLGFDQEG